MDRWKRSTEIIVNWKILAGCFLGIGCGVSSMWFYSMGLFLKPLAAEFGWSRGGASLGPLIGILSIGFLSPIVGKLLDCYQVRPLALLSLFGLAIGFALLGFFTQGLIGFLFLTFLLALFGSASSPISFTRILVKTFASQRGLALGIAITGTGVGAILTPLLVTRLIETLGWRYAYLGLSAVVVAAIPVIFMLLKDNATESAMSTALTATTNETAIDERSPLYLTPQFIRLGLIFLLCSLAIFGTVVHIVPMLSDRGLTNTEVTSLASTLGIAVIAGRIITGALLDRLEPNRLTAFLFLLSAVGMWLLFTGVHTLTILGTLFAGFAIGAELDLAAYLISRTFPLKRYGAAFGGIYACVSVGGGFGPLMAGITFDKTGSYDLWLVCAAVYLIIAASLAVFWKSTVQTVASVST